jgi:site-specific DNA recombinase
VTPGAGQRAVIYVRISLDKTGEALGVTRQQEACEQLAAARGWTVTQVYVENDTSASAKRPQYAAMLAAAAAGDFDVIIAWAVDRLTRSPREIEDLIDLAEAHHLMIATVAGELDLTTDQGRMVGRILGSVARGEVERKGARQKAANLQRATAGQASTAGVRTLGFEPGMGAVIPGEAAHIKAGFALFLGGASLRSIARAWAEGGFETAHGSAKWSVFAVRTVLRNPRYAGRSMHQGVEVGRGKWEALVSGDDFDLVQAILDDPARKTTPDHARRYLLPGIATCGIDGGSLLTGRTNTGVRILFCASSKHLCRAAEPIDALIEGLVIARLAMPDAPELVVDPSRRGIADLNAEAAELNKKLAELADLFADDLMTRDQFTRATTKARARLAAVTAAMADTASTNALGPFLAAAAAGPDGARADRVRGRWDAVDIDTRRAVVRTLFASIIVHGPGQGARVFDPETVAVEWARQ